MNDPEVGLRGRETEVKRKEDGGKTEKAFVDLWEKKLLFHCRLCDFSEKCQFFGLKPPFCSKILRLKEPCFVLRDPFSSSPTSLPLVLGGICSESDCPLLEDAIRGRELTSDDPRSVCQDCSVFYKRRFCAKCALRSEADFPAEIRARIRKMSADLKE